MNYDRYRLLEFDEHIHLWCDEHSSEDDQLESWPAHEPISLLTVIAHAHMHELAAHETASQRLERWQRERRAASFLDGDHPGHPITEGDPPAH